MKGYVPKKGAEMVRRFLVMVGTDGTWVRYVRYSGNFSQNEVNCDAKIGTFMTVRQMRKSAVQKDFRSFAEFSTDQLVKFRRAITFKR